MHIGYLFNYCFSSRATGIIKVVSIDVPAVSFATYVETPTGDTNSDLGSGLIDVWFYGILQKTLTPVLMVRTNFGYVFNGNTATGVVGIQTTRRHIATMGASVVRTIKST
jgi:hypothetical protein